MGRWCRGILFLLLLLLVQACAGLKKVHVYYDEMTDFNRYASFYWHEGFNDSTIQASDILQSQLKRSLMTQMQERGFSLNPDNPDLLLHIELNVEEKTGYRPVPVNYGSDYGEYTVVPYIYYERTTVLKLIDSKDHQTVWQGMMTSVQEDRLEKRYNKIERNILKIMKHFEFRARQHLN